MRVLSLVLVSVVACAFFARAQANFIEDLKDKVGLGGDHDEEEKQREHEKHKESLYQGGFRKQLAHTVADAGADRLIEMGKERADNALLSPIISMAGSALKKKLHTRINEFGQEEEVEGDEDEHEAREHHRGEDEHEERRDEEEDHHHHHRHHDDDDHEDGEKKKGGLSGLLGLSRRKRDTEAAGEADADTVEESKGGQAKATQGRVSKVVTGIKNSVANVASTGKKIGSKIVSAITPSAVAEPAKEEPKIEVKVEKAADKKD